MLQREVYEYKYESVFRWVIGEEYISLTFNCERADFSTYTVFEMEISRAGEEQGWGGQPLQTGPQTGQHKRVKKKGNQVKSIKKCFLEINLELR